MLALATPVVRPLPAQGVDPRTVLLCGPSGEPAVWVTTPPGWLLDVDAADRPGTPRVMWYRSGDKWRSTDAVVALEWINGTVVTGDAAVDADARRRAAVFPGSSIVAEAPVWTRDGRVATVRAILDGPRETFVTLAYVPSDTKTAVFVLTTRTRAAFDAAMPVFRAVVHSVAAVRRGTSIHPLIGCR